MAEIPTPLFPGPIRFPTSNAAVPVSKAGTNMPIDGVRFAAGRVAFLGPFPAFNYASGNLVFTLRSYHETATSGDWVWGVSIVPVHGGDGVDMEALAFETEATQSDSHDGTTAKRPHDTVVTVTDVGSLAAAGEVFVRVERKASGDTIGGNLILFAAHSVHQG